MNKYRLSEDVYDRYENTEPTTDNDIKDIVENLDKNPHLSEVVADVIIDEDRMLEVTAL